MNIPQFMFMHQKLNMMVKTMEKHQLKTWFLFQMPKDTFLLMIKTLLTQILVLQFSEEGELKVK